MGRREGVEIYRKFVFLFISGTALGFTPEYQLLDIGLWKRFIDRM